MANGYILPDWPVFFEGVEELMWGLPTLFLKFYVVY
ncbi:hypothetical protein C806_04201 [Lachnospiraceae bacterium 3-1]|nr:hypothetical protein C806_04201 [Lachnospiraceae bacterium 3-1]